MPNEAPVPARVRSPLLAAVLSLYLPGLGQLYAGRRARAVLVYFQWVILVGIVMKAIFELRQPLNIVLPIILVIGSYVFFAVDAARLASRAPDVPAKWYSRWYGLIFFLILGHGAGTEQYDSRSNRKVRVLTASMEPYILNGDRLLWREDVSGSAWRGHVVVVNFPDYDSQILQRIVGIPGDTISMRGDSLRINGRLVDEPYAVRNADAPKVKPEFSWQLGFLLPGVDRQRYAPSDRDWGPLVIPEHSYFLLGDNRHNSYDSRQFGFADAGLIRGAPRLVYWSRGAGVRWSRIGLKF